MTNCITYVPLQVILPFTDSFDIRLKKVSFTFLTALYDLLTPLVCTNYSQNEQVRYHCTTTNHVIFMP